MSQALLLSDPVPSVSLHDGRPATTSREVAHYFRKRHDNVVRDIRSIMDNCPEEFTALNFEVSNYLDQTGRSLPMYIIFRDGFTLLAMGYTGPEAIRFKLAYIEAFNRMEAELARRNRPALPAAPRSRHAGTRRRNPRGPTALLPYLRAPMQQADLHEHSRLHRAGKPRLQASSRPSFLRRPHRSAVGTVLHRAHDRRPALP